MTAASAHHPSGSVIAVVVTFDRIELMNRCLEALGRQTHPIATVVAVDNGSSVPMHEVVSVPEGLEVIWLRFERNRGTAHAFHWGLRHALELGAEWIWITDDDGHPRADALDALMRSRSASERVSVLAPVVVGQDGRPQRYHQGALRASLRGIWNPLDPAAYEHGEHDVEYASYVGPLIRADAIPSADCLPDRRFVMDSDDTAFTWRVGREAHGIRLVAAARVDHYNGVDGASGESFPARLRAFLGSRPWSHVRRTVVGLRNMIFVGRSAGRLGRPAYLLLVALFVVRVLMWGPGRRQRVSLVLLHARDGWRGRFRNVRTTEWDQLQGAPAWRDHLVDETHGVRDVDGPVQRAHSR